MRERNGYLFGGCEFNGTTDLYPKKNRELINSEKFHVAIRIQRWFRSLQLKKRNSSN